jgi:hypothetical protein
VAPVVATSSTSTIDRPVTGRRVAKQPRRLVRRSAATSVLWGGEARSFRSAGIGRGNPAAAQAWSASSQV